MTQTITITVTPERNIEFPPEIKARINPGEQYILSTDENTITLKKIPKFNWEEWEKRLEKAGDDPDEMTIEEICEIVREVRRENKQK